MKKPNFEQLTGRVQTHLLSMNINDYDFLINPNIEKDLIYWNSKCNEHKIDFAVASAFRSFDRQLLIWNEKADGIRPLKNRNGILLDFKSLNDRELLEAIMIWTHIPGVSRHHWGTDLDVFDASWFKAQQEKLFLNNHIYEEGGVCYNFHKLNENLLADKKFGFYRPYNDGNNFMHELWHYSHKKTASIFEKEYTFEIFIRNIEEANDLRLKIPF